MEKEEDKTVDVRLNWVVTPFVFILMMVALQAISSSIDELVRELKFHNEIMLKVNNLERK